MRYLSCRPNHLGIIIAGILVFFLLIAGCVISPRRVVTESPSPTPTPTISPTPTPTPTPMATTVPAQFLFLGEAGAPLISGFRINGDGSLAPVPGSPFTIDAPVRSLAAAHGMLISTSEEAVTAFNVDKETGSIQQINLPASSMADADPSLSATTGPQLAVLDRSGRFMYIADVNRAELLPFRVENGRLSALSRAVIPIPSGTTSIAIVKP